MLFVYRRVYRDNGLKISCTHLMRPADIVFFDYEIWCRDFVLVGLSLAYVVVLVDKYVKLVDCVNYSVQE